MALYISSYGELCHYVVEPLPGTLLPECIFNWRGSPASKQLQEAEGAPHAVEGQWNGETYPSQEE